MQYLIPLAAVIGVIALPVLAVLARQLLYVVPEGEQHVVQRFGRFRTIRRPGLRIRIPVFDQVNRLTERPFALPFTVTATTRDGATYVVDGTLELSIVDGYRYVRAHRTITRSGPSLVRAVIGDAVARRSVAELQRDAVAAEAAYVLHRHLQRYGLGVAIVLVTGLRPRPDGSRHLVVAAR